MIEQTPIEHKIAISNAFSRAAKHYDNHNFVQREIGERLVERCAWLKTTPQTILDLGSGSGALTQQLQNLYPKADIIGLDRAMGMCQVAGKKQNKKNLKSFFKKSPRFVCADMESLPFRANTFDLIISNCAFEWSRALPTLCTEIKRLLRDQGVLLFNTIGPDTLCELAHSMRLLDNQHHVNAFLDMHHMGDILLKSGLLDPVMDREMMTVTYSNIHTLLSDIKKSGSHYLFEKTHSPLSGKRWIKQLVKNYEQLKLDNDLYPASVEIIYGHAFKSNAKQRYALNAQNTAYIPTESYMP